MNTGILAKDLAKRILVRGPDGKYEARESLGDVPAWVQEAYDAGWLAMTADDDFTGVWIAIPGEEIYGVQLAVRAVGNDILVDHGDWIGVLKEIKAGDMR